MDSIDKTAARVLDRLVEMLQAHVREAMKLGKAFTAGLRIDNVHPITIESLGAVSLGSLFAVIYYRGTLRNPEMVFLHTLKSYYPIAYRHDSLGVYEESVRFKGGNLVSVIPRLQHWQADFADGWLRKIGKEQGL